MAVPDDLFGGDGGGGLDLSDEALNARAEEDFTQSEHDGSEIPSHEEDGEDDLDDESSDEDEVEEDDDADDSDDEDESDEEDDDEESFDLPDKLKGKSPEDIAKMYLELEKSKGAQSSEVGELRKLVEQQQQQIQQLAARGQQAQYDEDLTDHIIDDESAGQFYAQALQALDEGVITDVSVIEDIIAATQEINPVLAGRMNRDFGMRLAQAQMSAQMQPFVQSTYVQSVERATNDLWNDDKLGADAKAYSAEIVEHLKGKHLGNTQSEIRATLESALFHVRGVDPSKSAAYSKNLSKKKQDAQVEEGNGTPPPPSLSAEDKVVTDIFAHRKAKTENNPLFVGFGK